jgi:hypothetical protein
MVVLCVSRVRLSRLWVNNVFTIALNLAQLAHPVVTFKHRTAGALLVKRHFKDFAFFSQRRLQSSCRCCGQVLLAPVLSRPV